MISVGAFLLLIAVILFVVAAFTGPRPNWIALGLAFGFGALLVQHIRIG